MILMRMDIECIRNILLQAENDSFTIDHFEDKNYGLLLLNQYEIKKLVYHIRLANEFGFLKIISAASSTIVKDLSAEGHLFLNTIRQEKVWMETKRISDETGLSTLDAVKQIAINVASSLITGYFQR